jgi:plasmid stabilization system protein ParE
MNYRVRIVKPAQVDVREIRRYIAVDLLNPVAAAKRIDLIDTKIQSLKTMPARFPLVQDAYLASKGFRIIVCEAHLVFFIIEEAARKVFVMRVIYARSDWVRMLRVDAEKSFDGYDSF